LHLYNTTSTIGLITKWGESQPHAEGENNHGSSSSTGPHSLKHLCLRHARRFSCPSLSLSFAIICQLYIQVDSKILFYSSPTNCCIHCWNNTHTRYISQVHTQSNSHSQTIVHSQCDLLNCCRQTTVIINRLWTSMHPSLHFPWMPQMGGLVDFGEELTAPRTLQENSHVGVLIVALVKSHAMMQVQFHQHLWWNSH